MIAAELKERLDPILARHRALRRCRGLALCFAGSVILGCLMLWQHHATGWTSDRAWLVLIGLTVAAILGVLSRLKQQTLDYHWLARQLEQAHPELQTSLLAAIEQQPDGPDGEYSFLQKRLFREVAAKCEEQVWGADSNAALIRYLKWDSVLLLANVFIIGLLFTLPPAPPSQQLAAGKSGAVEVTPGDASVERGSGLVVLAKFPGAVPPEATLVVTPATGQPQHIVLTKNLNDPIFGTSLTSIQSDLKYRIDYGPGKTREYTVKVYEHPALERADATLHYPAYTGLKERKFEETTRVSAVEGTDLEFTFQMNKPVVDARLTAKDGSEVLLKPDGTHSNVWIARFPVEKSQRYQLHLRDADGRANKSPDDITLLAIPNKPPELKLISPKGDPRVSPLEELTFKAQVSDDFGVKAFGLAYSLAGQEPKYLDLGTNAPANEKRSATHILPLEKLTVEPDELVSYFLWADDYGPDGQVRRTFGDMHFAEVRPFDEIFRQGQPQEGEGKSSSQMQKLGDLQKQVILATWKLQRRETKPQTTPAYVKDVEAVRQAQEQVLTQSDETKEKLQDARQLRILEQAQGEMKKAVTGLTAAQNGNTARPLPKALSAEQTAARLLAKLSPREHQVSRSKSKGGGGGGNRSQRQLDNLKMKDNGDRYEKEREASAMKSPQQREQLQFLNRLKELAQRQDDVNERLKELQMALQEAKTPKEKEELERQLKRLREEQRQMLADLDELRQRMEQSQSAEQMADSRKQLDQTREDVRRSGEEMDKGSLSQALASGNRAQRDLEKVKEDFRKQTSSEFADALRSMRDQARDLAQKQEQLGAQMRNQKPSARKTLTDSTGSDKANVAEGMEKQREKLNSLVNDMKEVTQLAEASEPLLAKQLFETVRKTDQDKTDEALKFTGEFLKNNMMPQAQQMEQKAGESIARLREGVEHAADSVLGNELDALRFAEQQLRNLTDQVSKEVAKANPGATNAVRMAGGSGTSTNRLAGSTNQLAMAGGQRQPNGQPPQSGQQGMQNSQAQRGQNGERDPNGQQPGQKGQGQQAQSGQPGKEPGQQAKGQGQGQNGQQGQQPGEKGKGQQGKGQGQGQSGQGQGQNGQGQQGDSQMAQNQGQGQQGQGQGKGQGKGQAGQPGQNGQQGQGGQPGGNQQMAGGRNQRGGTGGGGNNTGGGGVEQMFVNRGGTGNEWQGGPLTGERYTQWSDRLREVEESIDSPDLRAQIARVRDAARAVRIEFKRHSKEPQWDMVESQIERPLAEIRNRLQEEIARRESKDALVPIDRDPVPGRYSELVRRYYEKLGGND